MKRLIINADDFGYDKDTLNSTIKLFEQGILTSATIMTDMSATDKAIEFAKENQDRYSFGLHFNIVDGHEAHYPNTSLTLEDTSLFRKSNEQRMYALKYKFEKIDIQQEFEYQLTSLLDAGVEVSHIDSHGHLHKFPQIIQAITPIMHKYHIHKVRRPQNKFQLTSIRKSIVNSMFDVFFPNEMTTDIFFMLENHENIPYLKKFFSSIEDGVTELGIHPGTIEDWRKKELDFFSDNDALEQFGSLGIELVNWNDV